jgi:UDP-N-acetylglucosamine--N-acetylmuramyl-(pentapeptide) pyrophosphoryl-undecaprenol N-acetylglucosamine transferase
MMNPKSGNTIIICGGHLAPALAVMEILLGKKKYRLIYAGRKNSLEGDKSYSLEYKAVKERKILFKTIITGRLQRQFSFYTVFSLLKIPIGIVQSISLFIAEKPVAVVSFGGYVAFPIGVAARICRVPLILHEQTRVLGLTNRILSRFASIICLSDDSLKEQTGNAPSVVTGIPLRKSILHPRKTKILNFGNSKLPLIYITGGSQGARILNRNVGGIIPDLAGRYRILHQCGSANNSADLKILNQIRNALPTVLKDNYRIVPHIDPDAAGYILKKSFLVISRAGANTVAEIKAVGVPAIFIPIRRSAGQEQLQNARMLVNEGTAVILSQEKLTKETLFSRIIFLGKNIHDFKLKAARLSKKMPRDAAGRLVEIIENAVSHGKNT